MLETDRKASDGEEDHENVVDPEKNLNEKISLKVKDFKILTLNRWMLSLPLTTRPLSAQRIKKYLKEKKNQFQSDI